MRYSPLRSCHVYNPIVAYVTIGYMTQKSNKRHINDQVGHLNDQNVSYIGALVEIIILIFLACFYFLLLHMQVYVGV